MKRFWLWLLIGFAITFLAATIALPATITLGWDPNSEPDLLGYKLYWRNDVSATYTDSIDIPEDKLIDPLFPTFDVQVDDTKVWYFVVTAYNYLYESAFSNEVIWAAPPAPEPEPEEPPVEEPPAEEPPAEEPGPNPQPPTPSPGGSGGGGCFINTVMQ